MQDSFYRGLTAEESERVHEYNFDHPGNLFYLWVSLKVRSLLIFPYMILRTTGVALKVSERYALKQTIKLQRCCLFIFPEAARRY